MLDKVLTIAVVGLAILAGSLMWELSRADARIKSLQRELTQTHQQIGAKERDILGLQGAITRANAAMDELDQAARQATERAAFALKQAYADRQKAANSAAALDALRAQPVTDQCKRMVDAVNLFMTP